MTQPLTVNLRQPLSVNRRLLAVASSVALICILSVSLVLAGGSAWAAAVDVPLGTSSSFSVLAGAGVTNTGPTTVNGDVGSYETTTITGEDGPAPDFITAGGTIQPTTTAGAKDDLVTAYNTVAGEGPVNPVAAELGGQNLVAGVYRVPSSAGLTGTLTLNGQGNNDAVFVFQVPSALTTASSSSISLINGAQACHVYWQIGSSATFGTDSAFVGNVLALTDITATTRATFQGRLLARNGAVTLDTNTITAGTCLPAATASAPAPTTATPSATPTRRTRATPKPTRTTDGGGSGGGDNSGGGSGSGSGGFSEFGSGAGSTYNDTDLPNAGGFSPYLIPLGAAAVLAGAGLVFAGRRPRGTHRV